jgi:hypothetical protein
MNQDIAVGAITWRVTIVRDGGKLIEANGVQARTPWGFAIVETTIANHGDKAVKIVPPILYTSSHKDIKYEPSQEVTRVNPQPCAYGPIQPNETKACEFIYELPPDGSTAARPDVSNFDDHDPQGTFIELTAAPQMRQSGS